MNFVSLAIAFLAIGAGSTVKGITGVGLPVMAVPVLSYFLTLPHAVAILIVPVLVTNLVQVVQTRASARGLPFLWPLILFGIPGLIAGTWVLAIVPVDKLNLGLGLMLFLYIGMRLVGTKFTVKPVLAYQLSPVFGVLAGFVQGAAGLCAAVFVPFVHAMRLDKNAMVFSISLVFLVFAVIQFVSLNVAGLYKPFYLVEGVLALLPVALFMPLGIWLGDRLSRVMFDRVFLVVMTLIGIGLIETGLG